MSAICAFRPDLLMVGTVLLATSDMMPRGPDLAAPPLDAVDVAAGSCNRKRCSFVVFTPLLSLVTPDAPPPELASGSHD